MSLVFKILLIVGLVIIFILLTYINKKTPKPKCDTKDINDCESCSITCINNIKENGEENK